jgi:sugar phosphate isomerase/epimerase
MSIDSRLSVCELTTPDTTFEQDLELISAAGATGVAISETKLRPGEESAQLKAFRDSGLKATICLPSNLSALPPRPPVFYPGPDDPEQRTALMCDSVRRLAPFEPASIVVTTGSGVGFSEEDATRIAVEAIQAVADVAAEVGTRLCLEPCRRDLGFDGSFVQGLPAVLELIDQIDHASVGVCYDTYHHWDEPDAIARAEENAASIIAVQVADWREPPRSLADRLIPGDGTIDLPGLLGALERGGYSGWYDLELFSDDGRFGHDFPDSLWKLDPAELLDRGVQGMRQALSDTGAVAG